MIITTLKCQKMKKVEFASGLDPDEAADLDFQCLPSTGHDIVMTKQLLDFAAVNFVICLSGTLSKS